MKLRIFLDTNVFIYAFEFPKSNSRKIIELLNEGKIEAVISERVIKEVQAYFKRYYGKDLASLFRNYLILSCTIVPTIHPIHLLSFYFLLEKFFISNFFEPL